MTEEVKKEETPTSLKNEGSEEVNYEEVLTSKDQEIANLIRDRDNYRTGLLKAKKELKEASQLGETDNTLNESVTKDDIAKIVEEKVQEQLMSLKIVQAEQEKERLLKQMAKELSEAKIALKNRPTNSPLSSGGNQEKPEANSKEYFSKEQIEELRKRFPNADLNKVIENLKRQKEQGSAPRAEVVGGK